MLPTLRFCNVVKARRKELGLTQEGVAHAIRTHKGYVSGIENDKVGPPSVRYVKRLARILKLDLNKLLALRAIEHRGPITVRDLYNECASILEAEAKATSDRAAGQDRADAEAREPSLAAAS